MDSTSLKNIKSTQYVLVSNADSKYSIKVKKNKDINKSKIEIILKVTHTSLIHRL